MTVIQGVLLEERERNLRMQEQYLLEIASLPKGCIVKKTYKSGEYYYLYYRSNNKIVSDYLGKDTKKISEIQKAIDKRRHLEGIVKKLKIELKQIDKVVR